MRTKPYKSLKTRIVIHFLYFILFFIMINFSVLFILHRYNRNIFQLFDRLNNTVSISYRLGEAHQHLTDFFNTYQEPVHETLFLDSLTNLIGFLAEIDPQIKNTARQFNEINYYYDFLEIQEMILTYSEKSKILLARARGGSKRALLYEHLYELRDYKTRIHEQSSNLLFRQTALLRNTVNNMGNDLLFMTMAIVFGTLLSAGFMIYLSVRMSDKITYPIHSLVLQAQNAARGDFSHHKVDITAQTEIQILIDAFNNMMDNTSSLISELEKKAELERLLKKAELDALNAQINPHFLFNTLNVISSLAMIEEADETGRMIGSLTAILRYYLRSDMKSISLREELFLIEQYLGIQKTRFGDRLKSEIIAEEQTLNLMIPPMILQPIVENAVKHGLEPLESQGKLTLTSEIQGDSLKVTIEDNGVGISEKRQILIKQDDDDESHHIGVSNVKRRMNLLFGSHSFDFASSPGSTKFTFLFPLNLNETDLV